MAAIEPRMTRETTAGVLHDKRRHKRYKLQVRVRISIVRDAGSFLVYGQATDISESGIGIFVPQELDLGQPLRLELTLPYSKDKLSLEAAVRGREGFRYGVEFLHLSRTEREVVLRTCVALSLLQ